MYIGQQDEPDLLGTNTLGLLLSAQSNCCKCHSKQSRKKAKQQQVSFNYFEKKWHLYMSFLTEFASKANPRWNRFLLWNLNFWDMKAIRCVGSVVVWSVVDDNSIGESHEHYPICS